MAVSPLCETKVDLRNREEVQRPKMSPMGKQVDSWEGGGEMQLQWMCHPCAES